VQGAEAAPLIVACTHRKGNNESRQVTDDSFSELFFKCLASRSTFCREYETSSLYVCRGEIPKEKKTQCKKLNHTLEGLKKMERRGR